MEALAREVGHEPGKGRGLEAHWVLDMGRGVTDAADCGHWDRLAHLSEEACEVLDHFRGRGVAALELRASADIKPFPGHCGSQVSMRAEVASAGHGTAALEVICFDWSDVRADRERAVRSGELPPDSPAGLPPLGSHLRDGIRRLHRDRSVGAERDVLAPGFRASPYEQPWPFEGVAFGDGARARRPPAGVEVEAPDGAHWEVAVDVTDGHGRIRVDCVSDGDGDLLVRAEALPGFSLVVTRGGDGDGDAVLESPGHGHAWRIGRGRGTALRRGGTGEALRRRDPFLGKVRRGVVEADLATLRRAGRTRGRAPSP